MEHYFKVKSTVNLGLAISSGLIMALFGVNYWLLWACLFFALNYISYVGSIVACVPPILVAAFQLPSHLAALVFASLLVANRFLWIDFLEIRFSGKRLNIDSVLMFLWLAYWGWVWGVVGLVLAFPMLNSLKIILASIESTTGWAVVMSED
jgi:predicted PurR-regulated permease PerM